MYPFNVRRTEEKNYLQTPNLMIAKAEKWLKRNGVEYEILKQDDVPDDTPNVPQSFTINGRTYWRWFQYIHADIDPDDYAAAMEDMSHMSDEEV